MGCGTFSTFKCIAKNLHKNQIFSKILSACFHVKSKVLWRCRTNSSTTFRDLENNFWRHPVHLFQESLHYKHKVISEITVVLDHNGQLWPTAVVIPVSITGQPVITKWGNYIAYIWHSHSCFERYSAAVGMIYRYGQKYLYPIK